MGLDLSKNAKVLSDRVAEEKVAKQTSAEREKAANVTTMQRPKIVVPNQQSIQKAIDQVVSTINNPEYQAQLTKMTQLSVTHTLQTVQKLSQVSSRLNNLDSEQMDTLVSNSVGNMMRLYIQFNSELLTLMQKMSNQAVDIVDKATPSPKVSKCEQPRE